VNAKKLQHILLTFCQRISGVREIKTLGIDSHLTVSNAGGFPIFWQPSMERLGDLKFFHERLQCFSGEDTLIVNQIVSRHYGVRALSEEQRSKNNDRRTMEEEKRRR
jgi:hypothetical protein